MGVKREDAAGNDPENGSPDADRGGNFLHLSLLSLLLLFFSYLLVFLWLAIVTDPISLAPILLTFARYFFFGSLVEKSQINNLQNYFFHEKSYSIYVTLFRAII